MKPGPNDWTTFGGAGSRANVSPSVVRPPMAQVWQYNALSGISTTPLVRDSIVIIGTLQGELQAVNLANGKKIGYSVMESAVAGTPCLDGSILFIPLAGGTETFVALDLGEHQRLWTAALGPIESSPLVLHNVVYVTTLQGILCCLNKADGVEVWKFRPQNKEDRKPVRSSPSTDGKSIFFGSDDGFIYSVDAAGGELRWKYRTGASIFATPVVASGAVIVGSLDGFVYCFESTSGTLRWKYGTKSKVYGAVSANENSVFFGSADGACHSVDLLSGKVRWIHSAKSIVNCAPLVVGNLLYVGSLDKNLYVLNSENGEEIWRYTALGRIRVSPVVWGEILLLTSEDKYVTALKPVQPL